MMFKFFVALAFPWAAKLFSMEFMDRESTEYIVNVIRHTMEQRKNQKTKRNDFIDLLMDALKDSSNENKEVGNNCTSL